MSPLTTSSKWSEDLELIINPSKSEHLPAEDASTPFTYAFIFRTSPYARPILTVTTARVLGLFQNNGLSADDDVARATKKTHGMLF